MDSAGHETYFRCGLVCWMAQGTLWPNISAPGPKAPEACKELLVVGFLKLPSSHEFLSYVPGQYVRLMTMFLFTVVFLVEVFD